MNYIKLTLLPHHSQTDEVPSHIRVDQIISVHQALDSDRRVRAGINCLVTTPNGSYGVKESMAIVMAKVKNADLETIGAGEEEA